MLLNTNQRLGVHNHNQFGTRWYHFWLKVKTDFQLFWGTAQNLELCPPRGGGGGGGGKKIKKKIGGGGGGERNSREMEWGGG